MEQEYSQGQFSKSDGSRTEKAQETRSKGKGPEPKDLGDLSSQTKRKEHLVGLSRQSLEWQILV